MKFEIVEGKDLKLGSEERAREIKNLVLMEEVKVKKLDVLQKFASECVKAGASAYASVKSAEIIQKMFITGVEIEKLDQFLTPSMRNLTKEVTTSLFKIFKK